MDPTTFYQLPQPFPHPAEYQGEYYFFPNGNDAAQTKETTDPSIHPYWKNRVTPRAGYTSSSILLPIQEKSRIALRSPNAKNTGQKKLLPPKSHRKASISLTTENDKTEKDKIAQTINNVSADGLDKYAPSFIPKFLQDVQKRICRLQPLLPVAPFPPLNYPSSFMLPQLIDRRDTQLLSEPPAPFDSLPRLEPKSYYKYWFPVLQWEVDSLSEQICNIVLWSMRKLEVTDWKKAEFSFVVPGLRENYPRLDVGDLVKLRQVEDVQNTYANPNPTGTAFEARIIAVRKRDGIVHVHSPPLQQYIQLCFSILVPFFVTNQQKHVPLTFNVSFLVNARPFCAMDVAVANLDRTVNDEALDNLTVSWLFPSESTIIRRPPRPITDPLIPEEPLQWKDDHLNEEQKEAVSSIALRDWPVPYLILGPAGTGKTRTIVEAVLQILQIQPEACILLCAPSNPATDTLVLRLRHLLSPKQMLRLNDRSRTFNQVPSKLLQYCYMDTSTNEFSIPPWKELMTYQVVACSCVDANILVEAQCTNRDLMKLENEITSALHPRSQTATVRPHWTHLIIDEAAQGSEPELDIPISVVVTNSPPLPPNAYIGRHEVTQPQLVLCGDQHQLGPIISSDEARKAELDMSLLQRLFERPSYSTHAFTNEPYKPFIHLRKNYRSHPAILMPPSALFYNDNLLPYATNGRLVWSELPNDKLPIRIIGCESAEDCVDEKSTWFNQGEIDTIINLIKSLMKEAALSSPPLVPNNIGIISPFRAQVWKLREVLRSNNLRQIDVGTVEDWQGRENRVMIISCVRSNARFLEDDHQQGLGLFKEPKRMNVAITRAKELLIIVGNPRLLQKDPYWKPYLQFGLRNNLYTGPKLDLDFDGSYISKLEAKLIHDSETMDPIDSGIFAAGIMARDVLQE